MLGSGHCRNEAALQDATQPCQHTGGAGYAGECDAMRCDAMQMLVVVLPGRGYVSVCCFLIYVEQ